MYRAARRCASGRRAPAAAAAAAAHRPLPLRRPRRNAEIGSDEVIPVPNVNSKILAKVIEYCTFHVAAEKKASLC